MKLFVIVLICFPLSFLFFSISEITYEEVVSFKVPDIKIDNLEIEQ